MTITASQVKDLRERTGAGMMDCKKALAETGGDMDAAVELLRRKGAAKADKRSDRVAAEGVVVVHVSDDRRAGALVEVNCETDFVAKGDDFGDFARAVAEAIVRDRPADVGALGGSRLGAGTVDEVRRELIAKIGENINVRRFSVWEAAEGARLAEYIHGSRIGVLVEFSGGSNDLGRDVAMHVAASRPVCVQPDEVPADELAREEAIFRAQAEDSGKPAAVIEKIVSGRVQKYLSEITLVGQPFVKDPDSTVAQMLERAGAGVRRFVRFEVGEGLERRSDDFVAEVMAQARGAD